jgi:hypothetical protein
MQTSNRPPGALVDRESAGLEQLALNLSGLKPLAKPDLRKAEALATSALAWRPQTDDAVEFYSYALDPSPSGASDRLRWGYFWALETIFGDMSLPIIGALHPSANRLHPLDLHIVRCGAPWTEDETNLNCLIQFAATTTVAIYGSVPRLAELTRLMEVFAGRSLLKMRRRVAEEAGSAWGMEGCFLDLGGGWLFYSRLSAVRLIRERHGGNTAKRDRFARRWEEAGSQAERDRLAGE